MAEGPRNAQVHRWRELGAEGRLKLGASLISLGHKLQDDTDADGTSE